MPTVRHVGTFHGVGQGLFHSARLECEHPNSLRFTSIHDCGVLRKQAHLERCVRHYLSFEGPPRIDLLTVSHLHWDHVSGMRLLLASVAADTVLMPYLFPIERALVLQLGRRAGRLPAWYAEFMAAPTRFLLHDPSGVRRPRRIVLVRGSTEANPEFDQRQAEPSNRDGGWQLPREAVLLANADPHLVEQAVREDPDLADGLKQPGEVVLRAPRGTYVGPMIPGQAQWDFEFFQDEPPSRQFAYFRAAMRKLLGEPVDLHRVFADPKLLKQVADAYRRLAPAHDLNATSLVVYSGFRQLTTSSVSVDVLAKLVPLRRTAMPGPPRRYHLRDHGRRLAGPSKVGALFTGDLTLGDAALFAKMQRAFGLGPGAQRCSARVYQVPHHGSAHNWCVGQAALGTGLPVEYVACAGKDSRRGKLKHPGAQVGRDLRSAGRRLTCVDETRRCEYDLDFLCHGGG
jgi:hypothetical protein